MYFLANTTRVHATVILFIVLSGLDLLRLFIAAVQEYHFHQFLLFLTVQLTDCPWCCCLNMFPIVEIWVEPEDAVIRTITLDGFVCINRPHMRDVSGDCPARGGGVALVFRDTFQRRKLDFDLDPWTFEFLAVMLACSDPCYHYLSPW